MIFRQPILLASFVAALCALAAQPDPKVRIEMWDGCLCGGDHARTYEQLKGERAKRMLFGKDVTVTSDDAALAPLSFLKQHLDDKKLEAELPFFWKGVVYRRSIDGQSYSVQFRGLKNRTMADCRDGDLIVYYQEYY